MSARIWKTRRANRGRCRYCEYTSSGYFAQPCRKHQCARCGHYQHGGADQGCGHPDPRTGWCECVTPGSGTVDLWA